MNIAESEEPVIVIAKTCGCKEKGKRVRYTLIDAYHSLCLDKRDIIASELEACERLLKYTLDETDRNAIEAEIADLKMALDLMSQ